MAEPDGTAEIEDQAEGVQPVAPENVKAEGEQEPPRRRKVSELLDGQDEVEDLKSGLQLVAPPIHIETIDAGQPIYQLDLSSDEPEGMIVEPEIDPNADAALHADADASVDPGASGTFGGPVGDAHEAVKRLIANRDRQVMAAERDGIGAYELAAGIDGFVREVLEASRRRDG